jgi:hypothetical protein
MLADRLTKPLPANQWARFLQQIGLVDMEERRRPEADLGLINDRLEALDL